MMAIGNQSADHAGVGKCRADKARRSRIALAHRIEKMSNRARARIEGMPGFGIRRV